MTVGFQKRIFTVANLRETVDSAFREIAKHRRANTSSRIDRAFSERIMLAVTQVNGCRYCSYGHSRAALQAGVSNEEIQQLLSGELKDLPEKELVAIMFAQHYAETAGSPDPEAYKKLVNTYGETTANEILLNIKMITIGNLLGNTFDSFLNRILGKPSAPDSSWYKELYVLFGSVFFFISAMIKYLILKRS